MAMTKWGKEGFEFQPMGQRSSDLADLMSWVTRATDSRQPGSDIDRMNAMTALNDKRQSNDLEDQLMKSKIAESQRANQPAPRAPVGAGIGADQLTPAKPKGDNYSWWEKEQMDRQRADRDNAQQLKFTGDKRKQDLLFIQKLMSMMGSGGMNGGSGGIGGSSSSSNDGYTEQIFNNAGAPQVVKLKNGNQGSNSNQSDILKMLMGMMG